MVNLGKRLKPYKWRLAALTIWGPFFIPILVENYKPLAGFLAFVAAICILIRAGWEWLEGPANNAWDIF